MSLQTKPLRFGSKIKFSDRWTGTLSSFEIDEHWEVLNVTVTAGVLLWQRSVKLPFSAAVSWDADHIAFECSITEAFAREIPPVAAPARPVSPQTPVAIANAGLVGALVGTDRRATALVLRSRGREKRLPVASAGFEGKTLTPALHPDNMPLYVPDPELEQLVREALQRDPLLTPDDRRHVTISAVDGAVTLSGNTRIARAVQRIAQMAASVPGVLAVTNNLAEDMSLELAIGRALEQSGLQRHASLQARATLGEVILLGQAPTEQFRDEALRVVSRVAGVRSVDNRVQIAVRDAAPAA